MGSSPSRTRSRRRRHSAWPVARCGSGGGCAGRSGASCRMSGSSPSWPTRCVRSSRRAPRNEPSASGGTRDCAGADASGAPAQDARTTRTPCAVIASVRHNDTSYGELLMSAVPRGLARAGAGRRGPCPRGLGRVVVNGGGEAVSGRRQTARGRKSRTVTVQIEVINDSGTRVTQGRTRRYGRRPTGLTVPRKRILYRCRGYLAARVSFGSPGCAVGQREWVLVARRPVACRRSTRRIGSVRPGLLLRGDQCRV
jgi:Uncharacterized conserved protein (DUF2293)